VRGDLALHWHRVAAFALGMLTGREAAFDRRQAHLPFLTLASLMAPVRALAFLPESKQVEAKHLPK